MAVSRRPTVANVSRARRTSPSGRADVPEAHADELALLESLEQGEPVHDARSNDINFLIGVFRFLGGLVDKLPTDFYDNCELDRVPRGLS